MADSQAATPEQRFRVVTSGTASEQDRAHARAAWGLIEAPQKPDESILAKTASTYEVDEALATAINMALCVEAPLLVTGEPGTGKTQVAYYLRWLFSVDLHRYQVRSTSTAEELRYDFDAVAYLHWANQRDSGEQRTRDDFIKKRPIWQAFESDRPCILLIDEIDKAPRDFPNDLLRELDERAFDHPFYPGDPEKRVVARSKQLVIATSNAERRLPDAFLRRCIVHHIELTEDFLRKVVAARSGDFPHLEEAVQKKAVEKFLELRRRDVLSKPPSTAEVLIWLTILAAHRTKESDLEVPVGRLPFLGALVKTHQDVKAIAPKEGQ